MRKQWPCSKCGFACSSTWRSLNPSKPVICNTCRSKGGKKKVVILPPKQVPNTSSSFDHHQISSSSSIMPENQAFTVSQIGMIFGNLPFEPSLTTIPVIAHNQSQEVKVKTEVVGGDDDEHRASIGFQGVVKIKQEYDCQEGLSSEAGNSTIWDIKKVQKKKRSKLPQYTLSPLARFINQLHQIQHYNRSNNANKNRDITYEQKSDEFPKFDDVLIYEKCIYVAENEIGLGAVLLSSTTPAAAAMSKMVGARETDRKSDNLMISCEIKTESSSTSESDANYSNCLVDVPIKGTSSE